MKTSSWKIISFVLSFQLCTLLFFCTYVFMRANMYYPLFGLIKFILSSICARVSIKGSIMLHRYIWFLLSCTYFSNLFRTLDALFFYTVQTKLIGLKNKILVSSIEKRIFKLHLNLVKKENGKQSSSEFRFILDYSNYETTLFKYRKRQTP